MILQTLALGLSLSGWLSIVIFVWRWTNWRTFSGRRIRAEFVDFLQHAISETSEMINFYHGVVFNFLLTKKRKYKHKK